MKRTSWNFPFAAIKPIEVRKLVGCSIAHALDATKGDSADRRQAGERGRLHVDEAGAERGGQTLFFGADRRRAGW